VKAERARRVLAVAEKAVDRLRDRRLTGDEWIIAWSAAVVLLRAVGHALKNVDRCGSEQLKKAIDDAWERWNGEKDEYALFWLFIKKTRDAILKQFELGAGQGTRVRFGVDHEVLYHVYIKGFEDLDQIELLDLALRWWHSQLDAIEAAAETASG